MATEWNFDFKAEAQPITLKAGKYKLECWELMERFGVEILNLVEDTLMGNLH